MHWDALMEFLLQMLDLKNCRRIIETEVERYRGAKSWCKVKKVFWIKKNVVDWIQLALLQYRIEAMRVEFKTRNTVSVVQMWIKCVSEYFCHDLICHNNCENNLPRVKWIGFKFSLSFECIIRLQFARFTRTNRVRDRVAYREKWINWGIPMFQTYRRLDHRNNDYIDLPCRLSKQRNIHDCRLVCAPNVCFYRFWRWRCRFIHFAFACRQIRACSAVKCMQILNLRHRIKGKLACPHGTITTI